MKILEQVKNRVLAWKRIFTQEHTPVNETSSWREILLELTEEENLSLWKEAKQTCGCFSPEEKQALNNLPYFQKIVAELKATPNHRIKPFWHSVVDRLIIGADLILLCRIQIAPLLGCKKRQRIFFILFRHKIVSS